MSELREAIGALQDAQSELEQAIARVDQAQGRAESIVIDGKRRELDRLAELIITGRTDEALQALHDIAPAAPRPATIRTIFAARAAEATKGSNP